MTTAIAETPTIFAPITAPGRAAVAAVRVSGAEAARAAACLAPPLPPPRRLVRRRLVDPRVGDTIDDGLVVVFPAPASFTGEDVVEFHLHGGAVPTRRLLTALGRMPGLAPAAPGEFSRRAFRNGRLDLAQAEAVADLVEAETAAQARQALRQLDGALGRALAEWQAALTAARARLEAGLDFADVGDVAAGTDDVRADLRKLLAAMRPTVADDRGERLRAGLRVALAGPPNAGKSSLLNALAGRDIAIVTAEPGTTRDVLEVALDLNGWPVTLVDAAGLRAAEHAIEAEGVRRALAAAAQADLRVVFFDGARWPHPPPPELPAASIDDILVVSKADLAPPLPHVWAGRSVLPVSVRSSAGTGPLIAALERAAAARIGDDDALWTRQRHRDALARTVDEIEAASGLEDPVLAAEHLRRAQDHLGTVTGEGGVEALLDAIFATFCIGK